MRATAQAIVFATALAAVVFIHVREVASADDLTVGIVVAAVLAIWQIGDDR